MSEHERVSDDDGGGADAVLASASTAASAASASASPRRIRLRRRKGWRKPPGAVVVARPSRWGNPFPIDATHSRAEVVARFERALVGGELAFTIADVRRELAGKDLACWCPLEGPCHADVLIAIAGGRPSDGHRSD